MWYLFHCCSGKEANVVHSCKLHVAGEVLKDVFVFTCDRMKRYCGEWHTETVEMFPEHIFLETTRTDAEAGLLTPYLERMQLEKTDCQLRLLEPEEENFLRGLCGGTHHLSMSRGYIRDGRAYVTEGPLKGMEHTICKIDRHKRIARVKVPLRQAAEGSIVAGLEIVEKI